MKQREKVGSGSLKHEGLNNLVLWVSAEFQEPLKLGDSISVGDTFHLPVCLFFNTLSLKPAIFPHVMISSAREGLDDHKLSV